MCNYGDSTILKF